MSPTFDALRCSYPSVRRVTYGSRGMVCTSQPLAAQAGLEMLKRGGNAVDAALAAASCLTVMEPTGNGLGSDAFALVWWKGHLYGLNGSGPAPKLGDAEKLRAKYGGEMPMRGWDAVTVPGAVSAWAALSERFGALDLSEALEPAAVYAGEGYPVSPMISDLWRTGYERLRAESEPGSLEAWERQFLPEGRAPRAGELITFPDIAATLREIGRTGAESFYRGALAEQIGACALAADAPLRAEDMAAYRPEWVEPLSANYRGYTVHTPPPNGHGLVGLMALSILDGLPPIGEDAASLHRQIEAVKLAFADGRRYLSDSRSMSMDPSQLLSSAYIAQRRRLIGEMSSLPEPGIPSGSDTVYLCTADREGNMVSYIQSNYNGFGSGIVVPGTGISLQNRGHGFSLDASSDNCYAPGRRPYHTIVPGFLTRNGEAVGPYGMIGGFMQPQGHVQILTGALDLHRNPQEVLDAPRWLWKCGRAVAIEPSFPAALARELSARGHEIETAADSTGFGRAQLIWRDSTGVLVGASDWRTDGCVAAW